MGLGASDGEASGVGSGVGDGVGVAATAEAKAHDGAAVAWHAARLAAMPATPTAPAVRRKPRRLTGDGDGSGVEDDDEAVGGSTGSAVGSAVVSTGRLRVA